MQINISLESPNAQSEASGPIEVGWLFSDNKSSVVFDAPSRVRSVDMNKTHAKSASRCPAVVGLESRYFEIKCPYDMQLGFLRDDKGQPGIRNLLGEASPVRTPKLREAVRLIDESEWRHKDRPTLQIPLPYIFICDEPIYVQQVAPFMHYSTNPWPGTIFGGRFPINVWPRPLQWAFEWHDTKKPLILKRGEPMFYVTFETQSPERPIQLVEALRTPELNEYIEAISGAVNYVNQTFSLFKTAEARRPSKLVTPKTRG